VTLDEINDPTYSNESEVWRRAKAQAVVLSYFWSQWSREYLTALCEFHRTTGNNAQTAKVGDVVQIHDDTLRGRSYRTAEKGTDGLVHSMPLRTSTGTTNHPIAKLYPLEITASETPLSGITLDTAILLDQSIKLQ